MIWREKKLKFTLGSTGNSASVPVASVIWDMNMNRDDPGPRWKWSVRLPLPLFTSLQDMVGWEETQEKAQAAAEVAFEEWLGRAGLTKK